MDAQLFWIILLVDVYYVYSVENTENRLVQPNIQMSREKASAKCTQMGSSLANYASVKADPTAPGYVNQLVDGESAWVKGFAKLSPFLAWHGCFNSTHIRSKTSIRMLAIGNKSSFRCSQLCLKSETLYIGIKNTTCYCISYQQREMIYDASVNDSLCSLPCENNVLDSCGGHSFVSVYMVIKAGSMHWANNEPSGRQCVHVKRHESSYELHTASCHTFPTYIVNGFICMDGANSRLETTGCSKHQSFCVFDEPSTRQQAYMRCVSRHGRLADLSFDFVVPKWSVQENFKYWIGAYRTFGISERYFENKTICLAAVKVNNTLYLEPDGCSEQKHYLCEHKPVTRSATGASSITTKALDSSYVSPFAYIIPCILIVVFLVIIIIVFVLYRRRKKHIKQHNCKSDDTYTAIYETDNLENGQTGLVVSSMQGQNEDSKCLISKSKPNKSIKQAQTAKTEESNDKKNNKDKEMQEEDYDKIDFKQPGNVRKEAYEETNLYNHVLDTTDNNYDTTEAIKSFQSVAPSESDDTYSHMKDGVTIDDYYGLLVPGKKQGGRGNDIGVNYCYSEDVGLKDSSLNTDKLPRFVIVGDENMKDVKNDNDTGETAHQDEPLTYSEISKVGAKSETEYSEIQ